MMENRESMGWATKRWSSQDCKRFLVYSVLTTISTNSSREGKGEEGF